jgi:cysteine-rich repeat protein
LWDGNETCDDGNEDDTDVCPSTCEPAICGDGFTWEGNEECDDANNVEDDICANDCTSNGIFYYADVSDMNDLNTAIADWATFRQAIDNPNINYNRVAIWGSNDQTGIACVGNEADMICQAIANGGNLNVQCDGNSWAVGDCGGVAVSATGNVCDCKSNAYTIRPDIGNVGFWGAVDTDECATPAQIIEFVCQ